MTRPIHDTPGIKPEIHIYFSDFFGIAREKLDEYGAFNVSLVNDLPLFIDPFLLFNNNKEEYKQLHENIIRYVKYLKELSCSGELSKHQIEHYFYFKEVKQTWLGFSKTGNSGNGLGKEFAEALMRNMRYIFKDFGDEEITRGTHLEKVCLVKDGVGRDLLK